jgi:tripartite-type tricarboxylate transporter receptor subunit TctC
MKSICTAIFSVLICLNSTPSLSQTYPDKPVRFIVPYAPGGPTDIIARLLGQKLSESWKQTIIVENRPGASGNLGTAQVAKSAADGYTVLINTSSVAVNTSLYVNPGYNLEKDLLGVANVASSPNVIVAGSSLGAKNLREAIDKAKTGSLNYASPGGGTTPNLSAEYLFKVLAKVDVMHVPYKGAGPALNAALTGEVQFASVAMPAAVPLIKSGRLQGLAVTSAKRSQALPDVATVSESGFPGFEDYTWVGVFVPAATPIAIATRINADIEALLAQADFRARLDNVGFEPSGGSLESFARYIKLESIKWAKVVKETGTKPE